VWKSVRSAKEAVLLFAGCTPWPLQQERGCVLSPCIKHNTLSATQQIHPLRHVHLPQRLAVCKCAHVREAFQLPRRICSRKRLELLLRLPLAAPAGSQRSPAGNCLRCGQEVHLCKVFTLRRLSHSQAIARLASRNSVAVFERPGRSDRLHTMSTRLCKPRVKSM